MSSQDQQVPQQAPPGYVPAPGHYPEQPQQSANYMSQGGYPQVAPPPPVASKKKRPMWLSLTFAFIGLCAILGIIAGTTGRNSTSADASVSKSRIVTSNQDQASGNSASAQSNSSKSQAESNQQAVAQAPAANEAPKMAGLGDTVKVGSWKVTVEKVQKEKEFDWSGFGSIEKAKGVFVEVFVTVQNTTNKAASVNSFDYKLVDSSGAEFSVCSEIGCFTYPRKLGRDGFLTQVPPRTKSQMVAIFDVAEDAQDFILQIERTTEIKIGNVQ